MRVLPTVALSLAFASALTVGAYPLTARAELIGISFSGSLFSIDPNTGAATPIATNAALSGANALARASGGDFYTAIGANLVTFAPSTGAITGVPVAINLGGTAVAITALATSSTGTLFAVNDGGLTANDQLWRIDRLTGAGTLVGNTGRTGLQGLAADATDALFGWDVNTGLQRLSAATGAASAVGNTTPPSASIQTLAFAADGTLYGAESSLYRIDPNSGGITFVGPTGASGNFSNVRGLEFTPARVPEPATLGLLAAALLAYARSRREQPG